MSLQIAQFYYNCPLNHVRYDFRLNPQNSTGVITPGGPGSAVRIATELRAGRSGDRIPEVARFSPTVQTGPGAPPASCKMGTGSFPAVKSDRGVTLTHIILVP
jgi:hypothetical protein